jgi:hypothetical protein
MGSPGNPESEQFSSVHAAMEDLESVLTSLQIPAGKPFPSPHNVQQLVTHLAQLNAENHQLLCRLTARAKDRERAGFDDFRDVFRIDMQARKAAVGVPPAQDEIEGVGKVDSRDAGSTYGQKDMRRDSTASFASFTSTTSKYGRAGAGMLEDEKIGQFSPERSRGTSIDNLLEKRTGRSRRQSVVDLQHNKEESVASLSGKFDQFFQQAKQAQQVLNGAEKLSDKGYKNDPMEGSSTGVELSREERKTFVRLFTFLAHNPEVTVGMAQLMGNGARQQFLRVLVTRLFAHWSSDQVYLGRYICSYSL